MEFPHASVTQQELIKLNLEIGEKEQAGDKEFFKKCLADKLVFRRARGAVVLKETYIEDLDSIAENPYEGLVILTEDVTVDGNSAVVVLKVRSKRKKDERAAEYRNVRAFEKKDEHWQMVAWINTWLRDL